MRAGHDIKRDVTPGLPHYMHKRSLRGVDLANPTEQELASSMKRPNLHRARGHGVIHLSMVALHKQPGNSGSGNSQQSVAANG